MVAQREGVIKSSLGGVEIVERVGVSIPSHTPPFAHVCPPLKSFYLLPPPPPEEIWVLPPSNKFVENCKIFPKKVC